MNFYLKSVLVVLAVLALVCFMVQNAPGKEVCYQIQKRSVWPTEPDTIINAQVLRYPISIAEEVFRKGQAVPPDSVFFYYTAGQSDEDSLTLDWYATNPQSARDSTLLLSTILKPTAGGIYFIPLVPTWMPWGAIFHLSAVSPAAADSNIVKNSGFVFRWYK
jgi:hypothetical protein